MPVTAKEAAIEYQRVLRRKEAAARLAPAAPPCFLSRLQWVEYIASCAVDQRTAHEPGPLVLAPATPAAFNYGFDFCGDCSQRYADEKRRAGLCEPRHLVQLDASRCASKEAA